MELISIADGNHNNRKNRSNSGRDLLRSREREETAIREEGGDECGVSPLPNRIVSG